MKQTIKQSIQGETRAGVYFYRLGGHSWVVYIRAPYKPSFGMKQCAKFCWDDFPRRMEYFEDGTLCLRESWLHIND